MGDTIPLMNILLLSLLGGVLAVDGTSVGQFMVSRPLVAGVLAGWLLGDPMSGLWVGGILELLLQGHGRGGLLEHLETGARVGVAPRGGLDALLFEFLLDVLLVHDSPPDS